MRNSSVSVSGVKPLSRSFCARDTETVAMELLGKFLVHRNAGQVRIGRIVETEAYLGPHDAASHSSVRRPRIGVGYAGKWAKRRLRFYIQGSPHISRP
jgi:3-methyladenine DNA glycosylase Mpg